MVITSTDRARTVQRIRAVLAFKALTFGGLAARLGCNHVHLSRVMTARRPFANGKTSVDAIARALNVQRDVLVSDETWPMGFDDE